MRRPPSEGGGEHDEVAIALARGARGGQAELAARPAMVRVRLVHHDALGRARDKVVAVALALDVVRLTTTAESD